MANTSHHSPTRQVLTLGVLIASVGASFWAGLQSTANVQPLHLVEAGPTDTAGDMNEDGTVNAADARLILEVVQGYKPSTAAMRRLDPNGDGNLTVDDALAILSRL